MGDPAGSLWRQWDLHIHSPASFHWEGEHFDPQDQAQRDHLLREMIVAINHSPAAAHALMDYWTLDGWFWLRDYLVRHPEESLNKTLFPGIELRVEAPTEYRLNTHFLFDPELTPAQLREFVSLLRLTLVDREPSAEAFVQLTAEYGDDVLKKYGFSAVDRGNARKMARLGAMTAKVKAESWRAACRKLQGRILLIQPFDTSDGLSRLDWAKHPGEGLEFMRSAHFFEVRNASTVSLFLGQGHSSRADLQPAFLRDLGGNPRPVLSGSDAHRFEDYGKTPEGRAGWINADLTFLGLKHCLVDPAGRTYIGNEPPKLAHVRLHPTKYMTRLTVIKVPGSELEEEWFTVDLPLNPGLVAIVGNKGSGKSALADIIALAGNAHCPTQEFLNDKRFKKPGVERATQFRATIGWANGDMVEVSLSQSPNLAIPERVRYLPQQYLEVLCAEVGSDAKSAFERELGKVIFSHVPTPERLGKSTLEDLVAHLTQEVKRHARTLRDQLGEVNERLASLEMALRPTEVQKARAVVALKRKELEALDQRKPPEIPRPGEADAEAAGLANAAQDAQRRIESARVQLLELERKEGLMRVAAASVERLDQRLESLSETVQRTVAESTEDASVGGVALEAVVQFEYRPGVLQTRRRDLDTAIVELENAEGAAQGLLGEHEATLASLQDRLSQPAQRYHAYLEELAGWSAEREEVMGDLQTPDTLAYLESQVAYLEGAAQGELAALKARRLEVVERIFTQILGELEVYKRLYRPVQDFLQAHEYARERLNLEFDVVVDGLEFPSMFLECINQRKRGSFYGDEEGRLTARNLVVRAQLATQEGVNTFLDTVLAALAIDQRDGKGADLFPESQLLERTSLAQLYNMLFGLSYLRPRLTLKLAGKEVSELSPGERGILLLVFYLLLDKEEIPLIIDQPEHNLDNISVMKSLEPCIRHAKLRRQIIVVTHNPNVAVVCDAEQIIEATIDKGDGYRISYQSGAIENPTFNHIAVNVLEGTWAAFRARDGAYQPPPA